MEINGQIRDKTADRDLSLKNASNQNKYLGADIGTQSWICFNLGLYYDILKQVPRLEVYGSLNSKQKCEIMKGIKNLKS